MKIIANAHVITCDPDNKAGRYNLLISENRIIEISDRFELFSSYPHATIIDASNKLVVPGFVNAHFHSESVLLRSRTDGLHCSLWKSDLKTQECIKGLLDPVNQDDVRNVYRMAYFSHLKSGTTCVGEFGLPFRESGFNQMLSAIDRTEVKNVVALQNWDQIVKAQGTIGKRHRCVVNIGRAEDFTVYSFETLTRAAKELGITLIAHVGEQRGEMEFVKRVFRRNMVEVLKDYVVAAPETVFVHLNHLSAQETETLGSMDASAVVCARSAAFKRTGYPSLRHLAGQKIRLAVGTDWGSVDMLEEIRFLRQLPLLISGIPPFSPLQLIRMATINGARALGLSHETGSIEVGKKADLTFFSLEDMRLPVLPEETNGGTLSSLLVNHLTRRDVSDVMIDGEFYVAKGQVMMMAEEEIMESFRATHKKLFGTILPDVQPPTITNLEETPGRPSVKILPFTSGGRTAQPPAEGFESGFASIEKSKAGAKGKKPLPQAVPDTPARSPDIPRTTEPLKENWLTFGEDESF